MLWEMMNRGWLFCTAAVLTCVAWSLVFFCSGDCYPHTRERQDENKSAEAERSGGAHQETRGRGGQSRERQERERAAGKRQVESP